MSGCSLEVFCRVKTSMKTCDGLVLSTSIRRNRKFNDKHLVQTKPKPGENTLSNIINHKQSIAGTSLEVSEEKVYEP